MAALPENLLIPSALYSLNPELMAGYVPGVDMPIVERAPEVGDVHFAEVVEVGQHTELESKSGRIHQVLTPGYRFPVVFGNRYATDSYEARLPERPQRNVDLVARSGMAAVVHELARGRVGTPTTLRLLGPIVDPGGRPLNTIEHGLPADGASVTGYPRAPMILVVGTSMNAGKSTTAVAAGRALIAAGLRVRASKVTGTASLKEILNMADAGAVGVSDFTFLGYPATYLLSSETVVDIFNRLDRHEANNPEEVWVVELADGVLQRETAMLLSSPDVQNRIDRLVLCAADACGALGAIGELKERYGLAPDVISGIVGSSPLARAELSRLTDIAVCDARQADTTPFVNALTTPLA
ncbi:MAG: hypothetical protein AAGD35_02320 [Actinomycetota bacterium]